MFETSEEYVRAVEASVADDASKDADKRYLDVRLGRYAWRELHDDFKRRAPSNERLTLEEYIRRCTAIHVVLCRYDGDDYMKLQPEWCALFGITPEYVAEQEALLESGAWDE
jgi:hypothetical protein